MHSHDSVLILPRLFVVDGDLTCPRRVRAMSRTTPEMVYAWTLLLKTYPEEHAPWLLTLWYSPYIVGTCQRSHVFL